MPFTDIQNVKKHRFNWLNSITLQIPKSWNVFKTLYQIWYNMQDLYQIITWQIVQTKTLNIYKIVFFQKQKLCTTLYLRLM